MNRWIRPAFLLLLGAAWWVVARLEIWPRYLVPAPLDVFSWMRDATSDGQLLPAVATSFIRVGFGFLLSVLLGTVLGILLTRFRLLDETVGTVVTGLQSLPSICWFPMALLWFGLNENAVQFVVVMGSVFAVTVSVRSGIRSLPPIIGRAARTLGARGWRVWWHVLLPASLPAFLSGTRQGWAFAWRSLMSAELLSQSLRAGVGHLLNTGRDLNDMAMVLGMILVILVLGLVVDRLLFLPIERLVARRWGVEGA
ncbi:MAG: ABC transporter permease [Armatimonadota bacterium]